MNKKSRKTKQLEKLFDQLSPEDQKLQNRINGSVHPLTKSEPILTGYQKALKYKRNED